jgi:aspartyl-tRNA synthetase
LDRDDERPPNPYRTRTAGELRKENVGDRVRLAGWVHRRRDHGGLIFIDLRDRWGITQATFDPAREETFSAAEQLRPEWSISVEGEVVRRPAGNENPDLPTGEIEVEATGLTVLNTSETPPFEIDRDRPVDELLRLGTATSTSGARGCERTSSFATGWSSTCVTTWTSEPSSRSRRRS